MNISAKSSMSVEGANGNPEVFDREWAEALATGDARWLAYPASHPTTQTELFERIKADQIDHILEQENIRSGRVLEYACGSAGMSAYFANRGFAVTALDLSSHALTLAQRNVGIRCASAESVDLVGGDVFRLPFADNTFDVVMSYGLLEHFTPEQLLLFLPEMTRILRPGGIHLVDIIHGRFSIRTIGMYFNFLASAAIHGLRGEMKQIPSIYRSYFENYYENKLLPQDWVRMFQKVGLYHITAATCRPFPILAVSNRLEMFYVALLKQCLPLWRWFDRTDLPILNRLGWMYLVYGLKPVSVQGAAKSEQAG